MAHAPWRADTDATDPDEIDWEELLEEEEEEEEDDDEDDDDDSDTDELDTLRTVVADLKLKPGQIAERLKASRRWEARAKKNADAAKRLEQLENEGRPDDEKLRRAEERAAKAEGDLLRMQVAVDKGLTPAQAKRLQGDTQEELEADADELLEAFTPNKPDTGSDGEDDDDTDDGDDPKPARRPRERLRSGASSQDDDDPDDAAKIAEQALGGSF